MGRSLIVLVVIVALGGCAGAQTLSGSCASPFVQSEVSNEMPDRSACDERAAGLERAAAVSSVRQTGSQTRTVGVPREPAYETAQVWRRVASHDRPLGFCHTTFPFMSKTIT